MKVRCYRGHPRILGGVRGIGGRVRRHFLIDETVEADVRSSRAAILTHQTGVLVQKAVQPPWEGKGGRGREGGEGAGVKRRKKYGGR